MLPFSRKIVLTFFNVTTKTFNDFTIPPYGNPSET